MKVTLKVLGQEWSNSGDSVEDALSKFNFDYTEIKGKGTITVSKGKNKYEHIYNMAALRRIFNNKITRVIKSKRLEFMLESDKETNIPKRLD